MPNPQDNVILIEAAVSQLQNASKQSQEKILAALLKALDDIPTQGGKYVWDDTINRLLAKITPELQQALAAGDFDNSMLRFFDSFDEIGENLAAIHKDVNDIRITKASLELERKLIVESTIQGLAQANINQSYLIPVRQALYNRIRFGATVTDTEAYLRQLINGNREKLGVIEQWVGQVARDSANQYEGTINQKVKEEYNLTKIEYVGGIVTNSREQCIRWVTKGTLSVDELQEEINWAYANGRGMIPGTDPSNFAIYRGGYNCMHTAIPTK